MSIALTTLNDSSAVSQTFVNIGRDRTSSEWLNTTAEDRDTRIFVKTSILRIKGQTVPMRRTLVQVQTTVPDSTGTSGGPRVVTGNFTITSPANISDPVAGPTIAQDAAAFIENLLSNNVVLQLVRGEV